jgi:hypothetical protein
MAIRTKLIMAALSAMMVLLMAGGAAQANRSLEISETRLTLTGRVTFTASFAEVICEVTFVKTVSRVIPKIERTPMGRITDIRTANCSPSLGRLLESPIILIGPREDGRLWGLVYKSFEGTLPEISGLRIQIQNTQVLIAVVDATIFRVSNACLYEGSVEGRAAVSRGTVGRLTTVEEAAAREVPLKIDLRAEHEARLRRTFSACPERARFTAELTPTVAPRIRLL